MKSISYLIESELEKAEVILAAKSIADTLQKMAENVAKMDADDVMPLTDPIRDMFGAEVATSFADNVSAKLRELTEKIKETKTAISDEITRMEGGEVPASDLGGMDELPDDSGFGDTPPETDAGAASEMGDEDVVDPLDKPAPEAHPVPAGPMDQAPNLAAGRAKKESFKHPKGILESDKGLAREFIKKINEGMTAKDASENLASHYAIPLNIVVDIISSFRK